MKELWITLFLAGGLAVVPIAQAEETGAPQQGQQQTDQNAGGDKKADKDAGKKKSEKKDGEKKAGEGDEEAGCDE